MSITQLFLFISMYFYHICEIQWIYIEKWLKYVVIVLGCFVLPPYLHVDACAVRINLE